MSKVTLAISVVGGLVLFSGALILVGRGGDDEVPARLRSGRLQDARREHPHRSRRCCCSNTACSALLAGLVGSLGAVALTWGVSRYALDIPWRVVAGEHVGGVVATAILVAAIGVLSSLDVLRHKPLATLRAE